MIDIKMLVDIDQEIDHVTLRSVDGYFSASCDYGVLTDNDFLNVLAKCIAQDTNSLNIYFLDFVGNNKTIVTETETVDLNDSISNINEKLNHIRRRYIAMNGPFSSRYAISDDAGDVIIISEESVPLSKCFFKDRYKGLLESELLSKYTY